MNNKLKRYWFEFEIENAIDLPFGVGIGCGVTAIDVNDALNILRTKIFQNIMMPKVKRYFENIDINKLDQNHVIPNMKAPIERGLVSYHLIRFTN